MKTSFAPPQVGFLEVSLLKNRKVSRSLEDCHRNGLFRVFKHFKNSLGLKEFSWDPVLCVIKYPTGALRFCDSINLF